VRHLIGAWLGERRSSEHQATLANRLVVARSFVLLVSIVVVVATLMRVPCVTCAWLCDCACMRLCACVVCRAGDHRCSGGTNASDTARHGIGIDAAVGVPSRPHDSVAASFSSRRRLGHAQEAAAVSHGTSIIGATSTTTSDREEVRAFLPHLLPSLASLSLAIVVFFLVWRLEVGVVVSLSLSLVGRSG